MNTRVKLLEIRDLSTHFFTFDGVVRAIDDISFQIDEGEIMGLVGETGCGKTVTALSIIRLVPDPPGRIVNGQILFKGQDILMNNLKEMTRIRGSQISMVFQEPMSALNPVYRVGDLIREAIIYNQNMSKKSAAEKCIEILALVGMPEPERVVRMYPFELSGGMRQRALLALGISCNPALLITDEPTTALDVTIQSQILRLIKSLQKELNLSVLLITHDLGVIATICDKMAVMYAGNIVEQGTVKLIFNNPHHPYTIGLMNAVPKVFEQKERLSVIRGIVPNLIEPPIGCRFFPRCDHSKEICAEKEPTTVQIEENHSVACHLHCT